MKDYIIYIDSRLSHISDHLVFFQSYKQQKEFFQVPIEFYLRIPLRWKDTKISMYTFHIDLPVMYVSRIYLAHI